MGAKYAVVKENAPTMFGGNYSFTKFHDTEELAQAEAERLSRKEGYAFLVLVSIGYAHPVAPPIEYTKF